MGRTERSSWLTGLRERRSARAILDITPHERIIASCQDRDGRVVVATTDACVWQAEDGTHRVPWSQIAQAHWVTPILTLRVHVSADTSTDERGGPPRTVIREVDLHLDEPRGVPDAVHACVTESVVFSERIDLDSAAVMLIARRGTANIETDGIIWTIAFESDAAAADPRIAAQAEAALREVRIALGI